MKSHKWNNKYVMPGGHIELGEKIIDALKREIKEETNLDIHNIKFLSCSDFIFDKRFWKKKHFVFHDFVCQTDSGKVKLNGEAQEYVWVSIEEAENLDIEPYTKRAIQDYKKRKGKI